jgi:hypothetical protein
VSGGAEGITDIFLDNSAVSSYHSRQLTDGVCRPAHIRVFGSPSTYGTLGPSFIGGFDFHIEAAFFLLAGVFRGK